MPVTTRKKTRADGTRRVFHDHFPQLLLMAYIWRYVTAQDVGRVFNHYRTAATDRTVQHHLATLAIMDYLKASRPTITHPKIFSTTTKARRLIREHFPQQPVLETRDEAMHLEPLAHEVAVSHFQTEAYRTIADHPHLTLIAGERRYFHPRNHLAFTNDRGQASTLQPDLGLLLRIRKPDGRRYVHQYFVEVDRGTESSAALRKKLAAYTAWYSQVGERYLARLYRKHGDPNPAGNFHLLITAQHRHHARPDQARLRLIAKQAAATLPDKLQRRTYLTTGETFNHFALPLEQPIWEVVKGPLKSHTLFPPSIAPRAK